MRSVPSLTLSVPKMIFLRLCATQTRENSPATFALPRSPNPRNPEFLICGVHYPLPVIAGWNRTPPTTGSQSKVGSGSWTEPLESPLDDHPAGASIDG